MDDQSASFNNKTKKNYQRPYLYEKNIRKQLRLKGMSYIDTRGCPQNARSIGPSCPITCSSECSLNFDKSERIRIFEHYWSMSKNEKALFFRNNVEKVDVKRKRSKFSTKRTGTYLYYFPFHDKRLKVCKVFFCNTLCISANVYYRVLKNKNKRN